MLDKYSEKVLKHIEHYQLNHYDGNPIPNFQSHIDKIKNVAAADVRNIIKQLKDFGYITVDMNANHIGSVSITHIGKAYFSSKRKERIRFWVPVTISVISLISSFRYEIFWLLTQLMQVSK